MTNLWKESFCEAKGRILVAAKFIKAGEVMMIGLIITFISFCMSLSEMYHSIILGVPKYFLHNINSLSAVFWRLKVDFY